jgi:hypothetical protein
MERRDGGGSFSIIYYVSGRGKLFVDGDGDVDIGTHYLRLSSGYIYNCECS